MTECPLEAGKRYIINFADGTTFIMDVKSTTPDSPWFVATELTQRGPKKPATYNMRLVKDFVFSE